MSPRKLHHALTLLHKIHYSFLLGLCIMFAVIAVFALRANNQRMVTLRAAVFTADKENGDIEGALKTLREYVFAHMNTNLSSGFSAVKPPIQLKYHYERLQAAAKADYEAASKTLVNTAEATCVAQFPGNVLSQARLNCARDYAASHPVTLRIIPEDQYKFDFISPRWTPDKAGLSIAASTLFLLLFVIRFASELAIRRELKSRS